MRPESELIIRWLLEQPAPPHRLTFYLSYHCNLRCPFCVSHSPQYTKQHPLTDDEMSEEELVRLVREASALGVRWWEIAGGEPFYCPQKAMRFLLEVKNQGMGGSLITNGVLLSAEMLDQLVTAEWDEITFSLDSTRKRLHDKYRGWGAYKKLMRVMSTLAQIKRSRDLKKPLIRINTLLTIHNLDELQDLVTVAAEVGAFGIYFLHPVAVNAYAEKIRIPNLPAPEVQVKLNSALQAARSLGLESNLTGFISGKVREEDSLAQALLNRTKQAFLSESIAIACFDPFSRMTADILGRVSPCRDTGAFGITTQLNLRSQNLEAIWYSDEFNQVRAEIKAGKLSEHCNRCCETIIEDNHALRIAVTPSVLRDQGLFYLLAGEPERASKNLAYYNEFAARYAGLLQVDYKDLLNDREPTWSRALIILDRVSGQIKDNLALPDEDLALSGLLVARGDRDLAMSVLIRGLVRNPFDQGLWRELIKIMVPQYPRLVGRMLRILLELGAQKAAEVQDGRRRFPSDYALELIDYIRRDAEVRKVNTRNHAEFLYYAGIELRDAGYAHEAVKLFALVPKLNPRDQLGLVLVSELMGYEALITGVFYALTGSDRKAHAFLAQAQANHRGEALAAIIRASLDSEVTQVYTLAARLQWLNPTINKAVSEGLLAEPGFFEEPTSDNYILILLHRQKQALFKFFQTPSLEGLATLCSIAITLNRPVEAARLARLVLDSSQNSSLSRGLGFPDNQQTIDVDAYASTFLATCFQLYSAVSGKERDAELFNRLVADSGVQADHA